MYIFNVLFYFLLTFLTVHSYKILGIFPSQDRNNYLTYRDYFRELANRNHEVTLISHFEIPDPPATYKDILLSNIPVQKALSYDSVIDCDLTRVPFETLVLTKAGNDDCRTLLNNNHVLHMLRTRPKYDVVIVESYNSDCGIALAANLSAPYIAFNPQSIQPWQFNRLGINFNSAHVPQTSLPYGREPCFFERVKSFIIYHVTNLVYYIGSQVTDRVFLYKYLGDELPSLESLASNASVVFTNSHQSVFGGVPRPDNVIDVGGIHVRPPKAIPTDIERFINEAEHGVIYVNLGSKVKDSTLPNDKIRELLKTFDRLPLRVLWKWDGSQVELPRNVMSMKWFPQYDVLKHHNVKAFVTNGGILSTIEAVDSGVPVIAIPLFEDEYGNAAALKDAGVATIVQYDAITKETLLDAVDQVLDPVMQRQAKLISRLWHDRPMSPLETAIYWTEFVARYQGAPNLIATSTRIPLYQQLQLDVYLVIGVVLYILAYVLLKILSLCCCCCCHNDAESQANFAEETKNKRVKFE